MDIFDNEIEIINIFRECTPSDVFLLPENDPDTENIYLSIANKWDKWTNSSGKSDPPPDFFSDELGLMMDVMRVDDHGHIGKNGKSIVNPTLEREAKVARELKERGVLDAFPNAKLILNVDTKLPTDEDHNYVFYRDSFKRCICSHIKKIPNYKLNHPNLKTIFMVFDESSPYFKNEIPPKGNLGEVCFGEPHFWFLDKSFMSNVLNSEMDFLVWFTPYKHCTALSPIGQPLDLPKITVINVHEFKYQLRDYDVDKMFSTEL